MKAAAWIAAFLVLKAGVWLLWFDDSELLYRVMNDGKRPDAYAGNMETWCDGDDWVVEYDLHAGGREQIIIENERECSRR